MDAAPIQARNGVASEYAGCSEFRYFQGVLYLINAGNSCTPIWRSRVARS